MIYGNKFLNITESSISINEYDVNNFMSLLEDINTSIITEDVSDAISIGIHKITEKIKELYRKFLDALDNLFNLMRLKIVKVGNKIIGALDNKINGKFNYDDTLLSSYDGDNLFKYTFESGILNEKANDNKKEYVILASIGKFEYIKIDDDINDLYDLVDELQNAAFNFAKNYDGLDDLLYKLDPNKSEYLKDLLVATEKYNGPFSKSIKTNLDKMKENFIEVEKDLAELKSTNKTSNFETKNGFFEVSLLDLNTNEGLSELRDDIRQTLNDSEKLLKNCIVLKKNTIKFKRRIEKCQKEYNYMMKNSGKKWFTFPTSKYDIIDPEYVFKDILKLTGYQIRCIEREITSILYIHKHNFGLAMKYIKKWGNKETSSTK